MKKIEVYKEWRGDLNGLQKRGVVQRHESTGEKKRGDLKGGSTTMHGCQEERHAVEERQGVIRCGQASKDTGPYLHKPTHDHNHQTNEPHNAQRQQQNGIE
jgi:hypothetical protein